MASLDSKFSSIEAMNNDDEEVTDAEAQAVLDELFGKGNSGGNETSTASTSHDSRMQPTTAATLQKAARTAKFAVGLDRSGPSRAGKARVEYEKALALYTLALRDEKLAEKLVAPVLSAMEEYLNRSLDLVLSDTSSSLASDVTSAPAAATPAAAINSAPSTTSDVAQSAPSSTLSSSSLSHDFASPPLSSVRREALAAMMQRGFSVLKRGVALYKQGKAEESDNEAGPNSSGSHEGAMIDRDWRVIVRYAEAMDCMLLVLKSGTPAAQSPMVSACLTEMLERSEVIKARHAT